MDIKQRYRDDSKNMRFTSIRTSQNGGLFTIVNHDKVKNDVQLIVKVYQSK